MKRTRTLVTEVKRLRASGLSWACIGRRLGIQEETAHRWGDENYRKRKRRADRRWEQERRDAARLDRADPPYRYPQELVDEARRLAAQGLSAYAISIRLRIGPSTARRWLNDDYRRRQNTVAIAYQKRRTEVARAARIARLKALGSTILQQFEDLKEREKADVL